MRPVAREKVGRLRLAHIINPFAASEDSDLKIAQPITFESMRIAQEFAASEVEVKLYSTQFVQDRDVVPPYFHRTRDLDRSILDLGHFKKARKLPLLQDILDRLHEASDADYFIYSNVDIALMPYFYLTVAQIIGQEYDSFVINRRTLPETLTTPQELPLMYAQVGESHGGHDCFIFRREAYPRFWLGNVCLGVVGVGRTLLVNMICNAERFNEYKGLHATFHIGNPSDLSAPEVQDYRDFNLQEMYKVLERYRREGRLVDHPLIARIPSQPIFRLEEQAERAPVSSPLAIERDSLLTRLKRLVRRQS